LDKKKRRRLKTNFKHKTKEQNPVTRP